MAGLKLKKCVSKELSRTLRFPGANCVSNMTEFEGSTTKSGKFQAEIRKFDSFQLTPSPLLHKMPCPNARRPL
jgi:hypothetical protein